MNPLIEQAIETEKSLPTIWNAPDPLWELIEGVNREGAGRL